MIWKYTYSILIITLLSVVTAYGQTAPERSEKFRWFKRKHAQLDSVRGKVAAAGSSAGVKSRPAGKTDSVRVALASRPMHSDSASRDSLQLMKKMSTGITTAQARLDSVRKMNPINGGVRMDTLASFRLPDSVKAVQEKFSAIKLPGVLPASQGGKIPGSPNRDLGIQAPAITRLDSSLPDSGIRLPETGALPTVPSANLNLPDTKQMDKVSVPDGQIGEVTNLAAKPAGVLENPKGLSELPALQQGDLASITSKAEALHEVQANGLPDVPSIDNMGSGMESRMADKLPADLAGTDALKGSLSDPQVAKEMLLADKKRMGVNNLAGREQQILQAMEKFAEVRSKYKQADGVIDVVKDKKEVAPGDTAMINRLRFGINFQLQKPNVIWFDINPNVSLRAVGNLHVIAGINYRLAYSTETRWVKRDRVYGPRLGIEYQWRRFLAPVIYAEVMNAPSKRFDTDNLQRAWTKSYLVGIKSSVVLYKNLYANTQMLYSLVNKEENPYTNRLVAFIGFEYRPAKVKNKKK